jgi:hypothetical protein
VRSEDVQIGMLVQVHRGSREPDLRGRIGVVRQRFGNNSFSPFEVRFGDKQLEVLWAREFGKAEELYQQYG